MQADRERFLLGRSRSDLSNQSRTICMSFADRQTAARQSELKVCSGQLESIYISCRSGLEGKSLRLLETAANQQIKTIKVFSIRNPRLANGYIYYDRNILKTCKI
jgi:hypothetical protein